MNKNNQTANITTPSNDQTVQSTVAQTTAEQIYQALVIDGDDRICRDIPDSACNDQPKHFLTHTISLAASKLADGFVDPKLILSWLLTQLGTSSGVIGLLVPIREAGALLPQLVTAEWIRSRQQCKRVWALGAITQGLAAFAMVLAVLFLSPDTAGLTVVGLLAVLAIARSFCSVSYKDVLGKTLSKSTRGTATGTASSIAAAGVIIMALMLSVSWLELSINNVLIIISIAAGLWLIGGATFLKLAEENGSTDGGENASNNLFQRIGSTFSDPQFTLFVSVRGLLIATALAPPFIIMLGQQYQSQFSQSDIISNDLASNGSQLGLFLFASALAGLTSSFFWGRMADQSSRRVLICSALIASFSLALLAILAVFYPAALAWFLTVPLLLFVLMIAYHGIRLGRATHLVDMATSETRANYTAVSNTTIGILLLFGSVFGLLAQISSLVVVISIFAAMSGVAGILAVKLSEVQAD